MSRSPDQMHIRPGEELWLHLADKQKLREDLIAKISLLEAKLSIEFSTAITLSHELSPHSINGESRAVPSVYLFLNTNQIASKIEALAPTLGLSAKRTRFPKLGPDGYRFPAAITIEISFRSNRHRVVS